MSKLDKLLGWSQLEKMAEDLKRNAPATGALLTDVHKFASASQPMPLRYSGNPLRNALTAVRPQAGSNTHKLENVATGLSHEKRKYAAVGAGAVTSTGVSLAAGTAVGVASAGGAIVLAGAITGGIALGAILVGIGFSIAVKAITSALVESANTRISEKDYSDVERLDDVRYALTHGQLEELARFHEKAAETEKELKDELRKGYVATCVDACQLAYKMWRHKRRLEDRLEDPMRRKHVRTFALAVDKQLKSTFALLQDVGPKFIEQLVRVHKENGTLGQPNKDLDMQAFSLAALVTTGKATWEPPRSEIRDYVELKFDRWTREALSKQGARDEREVRKAIRITLHEGRTKSAGDQHDVAGKVSADLYEKAKKSQQTLSVTSTGPSGERVLDAVKLSGQTLLDAMRAAGSTAATSAAEVSRIGPMMASSPASLATAGSVGFGAGLIVTLLLTELFDNINDKRNAERLNTDKDPVQRLWLLRSMLETKRLQALYDSYKKTDESTKALQPIVERIKSAKKPVYSDLVSVAEYLFRIQKHAVRMLAFYGVLTAFMLELEEQIETMVLAWDPETGKGLAEQAVDAIKKMVEDPEHRSCQGTCYYMYARGPTEIAVAKRLDV